MAAVRTLLPRRATAVATRADEAGALLRLLVLSAEAGGCIAVDLASGAFVRARFAPDSWSPLAPLDIAEAEIAPDPLVPDPSRPELVELTSSPHRVGCLSARRAERWLRPLRHPRRWPLLGLFGPAVPYWTLAGEEPSVAVIDPDPGFHAIDDGTFVRLRFSWDGTHHDLPLADRPLTAALHDLGRVRYERGDLQRLLGYRIGRVLVALTAPHDGYCYKVVAALLPRR
jgi:hypothetical protein